MRRSRQNERAGADRVARIGQVCNPAGFRGRPIHARSMAGTRGDPMKFNFFHTMPWTHYEGVPESWPVSSNGFDAERARLLYDDYITSMVHAEACEFDW